MLALMAGLVGALVLVGATLAGTEQVAAEATDYSIWAGSDTPDQVSDPDTRATVVGTQFSTDVAGTVTAIKFYKSDDNRGPHVGSLWTQAGTLLATVAFRAGAEDGWVAANLSRPVTLQPDRQYVVSYVAPGGRYADDTNVFGGGRSLVSGPLTATRGLYSYALDEVPSRVWRDSAYYVDVSFRT